MSQKVFIISNFTIYQLTLTIEVESLIKTSEKKYVLEIAESMEITASEEPQILKIIKLNEQKTELIFKSKLPQKLAFLEDNRTKEIFIQDLCNYKRISKEDTNQSQNAIDTTLTLEAAVTIDSNCNLVNGSGNLNVRTPAHVKYKIADEKQNLDKVYFSNDPFNKIENENKNKSNFNSSFSSDKDNINNNKLVLLGKNLSLNENENDKNKHSLVFPKKKIGGKFYKIVDTLINYKESDAAANEKLEDKIKPNISSSEAVESKISNYNYTQSPSSWNTFIENVRSNTFIVNANNQSQEDIILNKEKLLFEIMNDKFCEEIYWKLR